MTGGAVDFHTHAFPDALAGQAISALEAGAPGVTAFLDGKVSSLLRSMDEAGIERSVLCNVATRPEQFESILSWSKEVASERIIPFPSFHPGIPDFAEKINIIADEGFKGVKFHPFYQDFYLAEDRMMPIYEELARNGLVVVMHTGYDIAFERIRRCDPKQVLTVMERVPELKLVTTHLGAWEMWDEVRDQLIGKPVYMELSFSVQYLGDSLRDMLVAHPKDYILFGTDSPWTGQKATIDGVKALGLPADVEAALLRENALRLLEEKLQ